MKGKDAKLTMRKLKKLLVRKANDLIEARSYLSTSEKKAFAIAVAFANKIENEVHGVAEIDFDILQEVLEGEEIKVDKHFRNRLRKILKSLVSKRELTLIELSVAKYKKWLKENSKEDWIEKLNLKNYEEGYIFCGVIDDVLVSEDKKKVIVRFNRFITPMVLELRKKFTVYELKYLLLLTTQYGPTLYELLKKNEFLKDFVIKVEELKKLLGADTPGYKYWSQFYERVLKPAVEDINKHTDLIVSFEPLKGPHGKVVKVRFEIKSKKYLLEPNKLAKVILEIVNSFNETGEDLTLQEFATVLLSLERVNPAVALWFLLHYPEGEARLYAWKHIQLTEASKDIKHPDKFLESLIKDKNPDLDWLLDQRTKDLIRKELKKLAEKETKTQEQSELDLLIEEIENLKFSMLPYEGEIAKELGIDNIEKYLDTLVKERNIKELKQVLENIKKILSQKENIEANNEFF